MKALFFLVLVTLAIGYLLRFLRKREMDAFLDADMVGFQSSGQKKIESAEPDPLNARVQAYAALHPGVVTPDHSAPGDVDLPLAAPDPTLFHLKTTPFNEVTRKMMILLEAIVPKNVSVLVNVPLSDFTRAETGNDAKLSNTLVAYLVCESRDMSVICGLQHRDVGASGDQGIDLVKNVFGDIGLPLLEFPLSNDISEDEIRDQLDPILASREVSMCPRCGEAMTIRRVQKGKNAGSLFRVCVEFPKCRGVLKV